MNAHPSPRYRSSSTVFSAEIRPDRDSRVAIAAGGFLLYLLGAWLLFSTGLPPELRAALAGVCLLGGFMDCISFLRRQAALHCLRVFPGGRLRVECGGRWLDAELCAGSLVVQRFAWLRLRAADGRPCCCLVRSGRQSPDDWRRFLVISRHFGATN